MARALEPKLEVIGDAAGVLLDLVQEKRSVRLELAIIALIAFEIVLPLCEKAGGVGVLEARHLRHSPI